MRQATVRLDRRVRRATGLDWTVHEAHSNWSGCAGTLGAALVDALAISPEVPLAGELGANGIEAANATRTDWSGTVEIWTADPKSGWSDSLSVDGA